MHKREHVRYFGHRLCHRVYNFICHFDHVFRQRQLWWRWVITWVCFQDQYSALITFHCATLRYIRRDSYGLCAKIRANSLGKLQFQRKSRIFLTILRLFFTTFTGERSITESSKGKAHKPGETTFYDDFGSAQLDLTKWRHERYLTVREDKL